LKDKYYFSKNRVKNLEAHCIRNHFITSEMTNEYGTGGQFMLLKKDIKIIHTWPKKYEKCQFQEVEMKDGVRTIVLGVLGENGNITIPFNPKRLSELLLADHKKSELDAIKLKNKSHDGTPLYPMWILWKYYDANRAEVNKEMRFTKDLKNSDKLYKLLTLRLDQDIIHPEPKDLTTNGLLKQAIVPAPVVMITPEEEKKKKREKPVPDKEPKRQKIEEDIPVAKAKPKKPTVESEAPSKPEKPSKTLIEKHPQLAKFILTRLKLWNVLEPSFMKTEESTKMPFKKLVTTYQSLIYAAPSFDFLFDDEFMEDWEHMILFLLLMISIEAKQYPFTSQRVEAMRTEKAGDYLMPIFLEPKETPEKPTFPLNLVVNVSMWIRNEEEYLAGKVAVQTAGGKALKQVKAGLDEYNLYQASIHEAVEVLKNKKGLSFDELASIILCDAAEYFPILASYWDKGVTDAMVLLKKGPSPYDTLHLLCLRYLQACKFGEATPTVIENEEAEKSFGAEFRD
jgi:hypothetical protein